MTALVDIKSIAHGFDVGADDYIKKPFDPDELLIRIKAKVTQKNSKIKYLNLEYEPHTKELYQDGKMANLSETQLLIFDLLIQNINHVIDKDQLLDLLNIASDASLRVHVNKLKSRLGIEIRNVRGVGYMIEKI
jgi:DNA-binding response OmpR family regulator